MNRYLHRLAFGALLITHAACSPGDESPGVETSAERGTPDSAAAARGPVTGAQDFALQSAAEDIVGFLRGETDFENLQVADTVELLVPAEGGGMRQRVARAALRDRDAWVVQTNGHRYSFVPAASLTDMTIAPGMHINCMEGALSARVPEFAQTPHVGVRLAPPDASSCLQGWNATFVFDTASGRPRLTAAIYDQWEW